MAFIIYLGFDYELNTSVQVGDQVYHTETSFGGGFSVSPAHSPTIHIGTIIDIVNNGVNPLLPLTQLKVQSEHVQASGQPVARVIPQRGAFIMFSKDKTVNDNDLLGYYASFTFENNSKEKAELFAVGASVVESSK